MHGVLQASLCTLNSFPAQIAGALEENENLEALDINGNNVGPEGMVALANALKGKESLQRLEISYNPIEASGAKALIDIIKFDMKVKLRVRLNASECKFRSACTVESLVCLQR